MSDEVQPGLLRGDAQLVILLGGQVHDDQPVDPGGLGIHQEPFDPAIEDRVVIAHQDDGRRVVGLAECGRHIQRLLQGLPRLERALSGQLDRLAIGHRIGEGQAHLDDVHARAGQTLDQFKRGGVIRIARHDIGHEGLLPVGLEGGEFGVDPSHVWLSFPAVAPMCRKRAANSMPDAVCTLAPRPLPL